MAAMSHCDICGQDYRVHSGGHCRGGKYGGCCRTFASDTAGDCHRPVHGPCADVHNELNAAGQKVWRQNKWGEWTNTGPMPEGVWNR